MTRPDIDAVIKRLVPNCRLPDICDQQYCKDIRAVEAYIRELENRVLACHEFLGAMSEDMTDFIRRPTCDLL